VPEPDLSDASIRARMVVSNDDVRTLDQSVTESTAPVQSKKQPPLELVGPDQTDASEQRMTLAEALRFATENSPRLKVARALVERAAGQTQTAFAPFLPEVTLYTREGTANKNLSPGAPGPVGGLILTSERATQYSQAELDLQWTIWDFGRTSGRYGQAVSRERISQLQLARAEQTIDFDVTTAYLSVLLAEASRKVQEQSIRRAGVALDDAKARRQGGVADRDDVLRAEVQLSEARETLVVAQRAEFGTISQLNYTLGRNVSLPLQVVDWTTRPPFAQQLVQCLETAVSQRQEVALAREAVAIAAQGLGVANADYRPRIYIRLSGGHADGDQIRTGWQEGAAIHLDYQLYAGGRRQGEQRAAEAELGVAAAQAQTIFDTISLEINLAFRNVAAEQASIQLAETTITQARENARLVRVKYLNGNATPTDIVDAETTQTRSEQRYYSSVYDYLAALARLEFAMGTPHGVLLAPAGGQEPIQDLRLP
jgi:outer membrane protein TolC